MSLAENVDDLLSLTELAAHEDDPERRRSLHAVRTHMAARDQGSKVSEAAEVLEISQPTVRAWLDGGILAAVAGTKPLRVDVLSLAEFKRAQASRWGRPEPGPRHVSLPASSRFQASMACGSDARTAWR